MTMRRVLLDIVSPALSGDLNPERVVDAILCAFDLEQEWAVAEYDSHGNIVQVSYPEYNLAPVLRKLSSAESDVRKLREKGIEIEGSVGLASRTFTRWKKV